MRALEITEGLPSVALRQQQGRDIMGVLSRRLGNKLKETIMRRTSKIQTPWVRELARDLIDQEYPDLRAQCTQEGKREGKQEGKREGKQEALLTMLEGRGLAITRAQRSAIRRCEDLATLDRWVKGSVKVASVQELLAEAPKKNGARNGSAKPRAARAP